MSAPQVISNGDGNEGRHNLSPDTLARLQREGIYKDRSTICVVPTRGQIPHRVVESWFGLVKPMNQKFHQIFISGMEVGAAYTYAVESILAHPELSKWRYMLTMEEDNMPPPDGLLKLYESIEEFDVVGGLYWTKGEGGQPMIYGKPGHIPEFAPQLPEPETVVEANGLGMGFNLFRLDLFRDERLPKPWFKTVSEWQPDKGAASMTQDLYFYANARKLGYRVACDTRVKVGHLAEDGTVW